MPTSPAFATLSDALGERALVILRAARQGRVDRVLRGKNFGLVSELQAGAEAELFHRAATELGAKVARILPSTAGLTDPNEAATTARWLGRLYDAVECQGLPPERIAQVRGATSIPVLEAVAALREAGAALGHLRAAGAGDDEARRMLLQASLVMTFG